MPSPKLHIHDGTIVLRFEEANLTMSVQEAFEFSSLLASCAQEEQKKQKAKQLKDYIHAFMVEVEAGVFAMGTDTGDPWEGPSHFVELTSGFSISSILVSQRLYKLVMERNPSKNLGKERPVDSVSWYDAILFCNRLSEELGYERCYEQKDEQVIWHKDRNGFRLPTEAEWFCAARGGIEAKYSGGDDLTTVSGWRSDLTQAPQPQSGKPNSFGIYDMSGMCFSWCFDGLELFTMSRKTDPTGAVNGDLRVCRGGAWNRNAWYSRLSFRCGMNPMRSFDNVGIRLVRSL
ncbi:MAG: hypothetical protein CL916_06815 [Deltaproteobacteria bacterium]|nr:hypothetical protein [Deltaproteobacteria bacterium]